MIEKSFAMSKGRTIQGLGQIGVILGRNGCGKSTLLRDIESSGQFPISKYISPERTGTFVYASNIDEQLRTNTSYLPTQRRTNQVRDFKQQSFALLMQLESRILRRVEHQYMTDPGTRIDTFDAHLKRINSLLDNVAIRRPSGSYTDFRMVTLSDEQPAHAQNLSSGEAELICLAIECLAFEFELVKDAEAVLLLDEPDVHLHPDLQSRLMKLIVDLSDEKGFRVIIATHSTAILSALQNVSDPRVCLMRSGDLIFQFRKVSEVMKSILPVFGAHPLSRVFAESPLLLVEGDDECRIWQQVVRSCPEIKVSPCSVGGKAQLASFEAETNLIINAVYNNATAYSLRDGDGIKDPITDNGSIIRFRLNCFSSENLLLTDEVLAKLGSTWAECSRKLGDWATANPTHPRSKTVLDFIQSGADRFNSDVKDLRHILLLVLDCQKPWEVLVGQSIADKYPLPLSDCAVPGSLGEALGEKICKNILNKRFE